MIIKYGIFGLILFFLGLLIMKWPSGAIKFMFSRIGSNNFKAWFGKDEGKTFVKGFAVVLFVLGTISFIISFLL